MSTYIIDRITMKSWVEDFLVEDPRCQKFLADYPEAMFFGIDDGDVYAAFTSQAEADRWLAAMEADTREQIRSRTGKEP